ncbi:MAG TPA: hypothetical protein VFV50_07385 [Bdellovibrionales bacterium]|nr:hypothetical protein [Bdellovibrionales bacterium]
MRGILLLLIYLSVFGATSGLGAEFRRSVDLEWEPIDDTPMYEIEISKHVGGGKRKDPQVFKVKKASWTGRLKPGQYEMRLRSFDARYVPGEWSPPSLFWVRLPSPKLIKPAPDEQFKAPDDQSTDIEFAWEPVAGAREYRIDVKSLKGDWTKSDTVTETSLKLEVPVAQPFTWRVTALLPDEEKEAEPGEFSTKFAVVGKAIETPKIAVPSTEFVRELTWDKAEHAEKYEFAISRLDKDKWVPVEKGTTEKTTVKFKEKHKGGQYRIVVKALAQAREPSNDSLIEFKVYDGDRSPAAVEEAQMREAIEKPTNWYTIFSYYITQMDYAGHSRETGFKTTYNALGGTGRVGVGHVIPGASWGVYGTLDLSGFIIGTQNFTFASGELHALWRTYLGTRTQIRASGGIFYKELPDTIPSAQGSGYNMSKMSSVGPHVGFDIWRPVSMKLGIQVNGRVYYNALGTDVPNRLGHVPTLSYQFGLLGSLKLSRDVTGFAGYAYRRDNGAYEARVSRSADDPSDANPGDVNTVTITGHYLNLLMELGF